MFRMLMKALNALSCLLSFLSACSCLSSIPERILFIRHGETAWDQSMLLDGPQDLPLTSFGREQAMEAAQNLESYLKKHALHKIKVYTSPLRRACETAQIVCEHIGEPPLIEPSLRERYFGDHRLLKTQSELLDQTPPDAESEALFFERIKDVIEHLQANNQGDTYLIVSHAKVFECMSLILCGKSSKIDFAQVYAFQKNQGKWVMEGINDHS